MVRIGQEAEGIEEPVWTFWGRGKIHNGNSINDETVGVYSNHLRVKWVHKHCHTSAAQNRRVPCRGKLPGGP